MSEHTKGPWQLRYALLHPEEVRAVGDADGSFIADCYTTNRTLEEIAANARLIASAPELLAACEEVLAIAEDRQAGTWDDVMLLMRAAIAKARQP